MDLRTIPDLTPRWAPIQLAPDETAQVNVATGVWYGVRERDGVVRKLGQLVNVSRTLAYDQYIGRSFCPKTGQRSIWGNPFKAGIDGTLEQVIARYEVWILSHPELREKLPTLAGKVLGCWCTPSPCHGEVLLRLANRPEGP